MVGLIGDGVAVELAVLGVIGHASRQALGIALNERNRRFQLMRHVDDKLLPHIVDTLLLLDLLRQLIIGLLQLTDRLLQIRRQTVERLSQLVNLIAVLLAGVLHREIQLTHSVGQSRHLNKRARKLTRDNIAAPQTNQQRTAAGNQQKHQIQRRILFDIRIGHICDQIFTVFRIQHADQTQILVIIAQTDRHKAVFVFTQIYPVTILDHGRQHRKAAELLLHVPKIKPYVALLHGRRGHHIAVIGHHRQTNGTAALIAVQQRGNIRGITRVAGADAAVGITQLASACHHIVILIKKHVEQHQNTDKHQRDNADRGKKLKPD